MKLSSVKELIIQLMYAVYIQNYNVTVLFKEKNHNCKQINCMICLLLLCCCGIEVYRS